MKRLFELLKLPLSRKRLYFKIWSSLAFTRLKLSFFGYSHFKKSRQSVAETKVDVDPKDISRIIERVSQGVPNASCLTQAICAQRLLKSYGHEVSIRIGVKADKQNSMEAHAWVLIDDEVILGGEQENLNEYSTLTELSSINFK